MNSKGYYYLIDLNFLKASPSVFYRKNFDRIYIEWIASVSRGKMENCEEQKKKNVFGLIFKKVEKCAAI